MEFKDILRDIIIEFGVSQNEFARKVGFASGQISDWVNGKVKPSFDALHQICDRLNIPADRLLGINVSLPLPIPPKKPVSVKKR